MQAIIENADLQQAVKVVSKAIGRKKYFPVLSGVRISGNGTGLEMATTNLEMYAHVYAGGIVENDGHEYTVVSLDSLADIVKALPKQGETVLETSGESIVIGGASLRMMPAEDYPDIDLGEDLQCIARMSGKEIKRIAQRIAATAIKATQTTRPSLTTIHIETRASLAKFIGCDGYRLLIETAKADTDGLTIGVDAQLFKKACSAFSAKDDISIHIASLGDSRTLRITNNAISFDIREISDEFPDYTRVIPTAAFPAATEVVVGVAELLGLVKRAIPCTHPDTHGMTIDLEEGTLTVYASSEKAGDFIDSISAMVRLKVESTDPLESFSLTCDAKMLETFLTGLDDEALRIILTGDLQAMRFEPIEGRAWQYVQMPINPKK